LKHTTAHTPVNEPLPMVIAEGVAMINSDFPIFCKVKGGKQYANSKARSNLTSYTAINFRTEKISIIDGGSVLAGASSETLEDRSVRSGFGFMRAHPNAR
jgi:hypothetical protein